MKTEQMISEEHYRRYKPEITWVCLRCYIILNISVPSQAPSVFTVMATNSTTIKASWLLSPGDSERGIVKGFKLFYKKKAVAGLPMTLTINGPKIHTYYAVGLDKNTEYEFQLLAFSLAGDGPKSSLKVTRTKDNGNKHLYSVFYFLFLYFLNTCGRLDLIVFELF